MNNQPVTIEQLMQAMSVLAVRPPYQGLDAEELRERAYDFVCESWEWLEKVPEQLDRREGLKREAERLKAAYVAEDRVSYDDALLQVTVTKEPTKPKKAIFWQTVSGVSQTHWRWAKQLGIPRKDLDGLKERYQDEWKAYISAQNTRSAKRPRK